MTAREEPQTQSLGLAREELAAAVYDAVRSASNRVAWDELCPRSQKYWLDITDALLASPALARMIREAKAEAWDEGVTRAWESLAAYAYTLDFYLDDNPYHDQTEETP